MKKIITLFLAIAGMVSTASATVRIYIQPDKWADAGAVLKLNLNKSGSDYNAVELTNSNLYKAGIYFYDVDENQYNQFQILRFDPNNLSNQWNYSGQLSISTSALYIMGNVDNNKTVTPSSYLPCNYYFTSSLDSWTSASLMSEETSGTFTYTFNPSTYTGKYFVWAPGEAFSSTGAMNNWNKAIRPKNTTDTYPGYKNNHWVLFSNLTYADGTSQLFDGTDASDANLWYVPTIGEGNTTYAPEGTVSISFVKASNSATITCAKTVTIGDAGYATYSNGEMCTVSGANAIYVVDVNNTNSVHMKEMETTTIWPASEGMILKGNKNDVVTINAVESGTAASTIGTNYLVGSGNSTADITAGTGIYIFNWDGSNASSVGFYLANSGTLGAHKAYLDVSGATAREFLAFDFGEETGINATAMNHENMNDGATYNLSGQRVAQPTKGLYIVNGKKVVVK